MAYKHTNSKGVTYYLHSTEVQLRGAKGKPQTIYFFAKNEKHDKGTPVTELPEGREVYENPRNGFPVVRKKK